MAGTKGREPCFTIEDCGEDRPGGEKRASHGKNVRLFRCRLTEVERDRMGTPSVGPKTERKTLGQTDDAIKPENSSGVKRRGGT